jgi:hypothetical protein
MTTNESNPQITNTNGDAQFQHPEIISTINDESKNVIINRQGNNLKGIVILLLTVSKILVIIVCAAIIGLLYQVIRVHFDNVIPFWGIPTVIFIGLLVGFVLWILSDCIAFNFLKNKTGMLLQPKDAFLMGLILFISLFILIEFGMWFSICGLSSCNNLAAIFASVSVNIGLGAILLIALLLLYTLTAFVFSRLRNKTL